MTVPVFVDTNILIYSRDAREPVKAKQSAAWLRRLGPDGMIVSPQVLNELYSVGLTKYKSVGRQALAEWIAELRPHCTAPLDAGTVTLAMEIHRDHALSWWDCPIVASALLAGCRYLLSEDMQHGQSIRSLRLINPFLADPAVILDNS